MQTESTTQQHNGSVAFSRIEDFAPGPHMSSEAYTTAAIVLFFIGFFGFFLNLLVIILMLREKKLWTPLNIVLFNLVCSDFSVAVLGNPFTLAAAVFRRWIFGRSMCVLYGFFMSLFGIAAITTLTVLSFERYIMISKPFHTHRLTPRNSRFIIIGIWVYSSLLTVPPLLGWGEYRNEGADISCSVNWETKSVNATSYIIFLFAFGLVIPVFVISFSYMNIILTMKQKTMRMGRVTKAESRVTVMVGVMILAFLTAWMPYAILALVIAFGDASFVSPGLAVIPALFAKSSICYNPVVYVMLNTQFRAAWQNLFGIKVSVIEDDKTDATTMTPSGKQTTRNNGDYCELQKALNKLADKKLTMNVACDKNLKLKTTVIRCDVDEEAASGPATQPTDQGMSAEAESEPENEKFDRNVAEEIEMRFIQPNKLIANELHCD